MTEIKETVAIQFIKGENEKGHPEIRLFRDLDGKKGKAVYKIINPTTITVENFKSIQKMYLIDKEGNLMTKKILVSISDNHIKEVTSTYSWNSEKEFERFIRFSIRYANSLTNN
tara:strand:+ start:678 stop:1019 length:342 start_codon:yes stop_codon:yes gene_type:complete